MKVHSLIQLPERKKDDEDIMLWAHNPEIRALFEQIIDADLTDVLVSETKNLLEKKKTENTIQEDGGRGDDESENSNPEPQINIDALLPEKPFSYSEGVEMYKKQYNKLTKTLVIPEGYTHILELGLKAYEEEVKRLVLPKSIRHINVKALNNCTQLKKVEVAEENPYYCAIDGVLCKLKDRVQIWRPEQAKKPELIDEKLKMLIQMRKESVIVASNAKNSSVVKERQRMVCDISEQRCDFSVICVHENGTGEVLSVNMDFELGVKAFDGVLADWMLRELQTQTGVDLSSHKFIRPKVEGQAERVRRELVKGEPVNVFIPQIYSDWQMNKHYDLNLTLTKKRYSELAVVLFDRFSALVKKTLTKANIKPGEWNIERVELKDEAGNIPAIKETLLQLIAEATIKIVIEGMD